MGSPLQRMSPTCSAGLASPRPYVLVRGYRQKRPAIDPAGKRRSSSSQMREFQQTPNRQ